MLDHFPRKHFGQNFLKDKFIIDKIIAVLHLQPEDNVVEIGPGLGALTHIVIEQVKHLNVIEIDKDLSAKLVNTYPAAKLTLHQIDALKFDFATLVKENNPLRVFGNLPYNISTPLLFHLITFAPFIQDMLFMLQKEVVMRMVATPNHHEYGRLSIMIQYHCEVSALFDVKPEAFFPAPKVTSSIVRLKPYGNKPRPHPLARNEIRLSQMAAFQHRRKTLRNALKGVVGEHVFEQLGIDPKRRPETLSVTEFVNLCNISSGF
jgi:16S rRNA (adenine1518-N6/adenine1519-N6)-dimethyltransferase